MRGSCSPNDAETKELTEGVFQMQEELAGAFASNITREFWRKRMEEIEKAEGRESRSGGSSGLNRGSGMSMSLNDHLTDKSATSGTIHVGGTFDETFDLKQPFR